MRLIDADVFESVELPEDHNYSFYDGVLYVLDMISEQPTVAPPHWISVEDRLPEPKQAEPAELFPSKTWLVELNLDPGDLQNLIELFEYQLFDHLKFLLEEGELDNIGYLRSMVHIYDELRAVQAEEGSGRDRLACNEA